MSRAWEGLLAGAVAALIAAASGSPVAAATDVRPVRHDTATCLAPMDGPDVAPYGGARPALPLITLAVETADDGWDAEATVGRAEVVRAGTVRPATTAAVRAVAMDAEEARAGAVRARSGVLQPAPRQHHKNCEPEVYEGEFGVPLWRGPPWGVPSLGGIA